MEDIGDSFDAGPPEDPKFLESSDSSGPDLGEPEAYLVELEVPDADLSALSDWSASSGLELDQEFEPVPMDDDEDESAGATDRTVVVRCFAPSGATMDDLRANELVREVWPDTQVEGFFESPSDPQESLDDEAAAVRCPYGKCDCDSRTPKGNGATVRSVLGVDRVWAAGLRGKGIVVGIVDGGITARGRPVASGETNRRIDNVIGGWPTNDWGTRARAWREHGNMCATDVLLMAPEARLYDMRISGAGGSTATIGRALSAYNWAIQQHRRDGTPHVLSNSWGIFQESWDRAYARNPRHPFTRKVVQAINRGIVVLFAAGNCGGTCRPADSRCGGDLGPGRSIWGANGHPAVLTVGAVNTRKEFVGYSSRGPAALDPLKPDFCGITHFTGYFRSDSGTSAATPVVAGVAALLKQAKRSAGAAEVKEALASTALDLGPRGWDQHSGAGMIQAKAALDRIRLRRTDRVRTGTQFTGRLSSKQTVCWFTFNWPAHWQVIWNVVPLTAASGRPQISWETRVERATNNRITYWICVKNLTDRPVNIEGRYVVAG